MNTDIKQRWVTALRSGDYKQAVDQGWGGGREDPDPEKQNYCCLNVLCDVVNGHSVFHYQGPPGYKTSGFDILDIVDSSDPSGSLTTELINMNDAGISFSAIADYIELNI